MVPKLYNNDLETVCGCGIQRMRKAWRSKDMRREIKAVTRVICTPDGQTHGCGSAVRSDREYETILCGPDGGAQAQDFEADGRRLFCQRDYSF